MIDDPQIEVGVGDKMAQFTVDESHSGRLSRPYFW
jgi:hypothetical protein